MQWLARKAYSAGSSQKMTLNRSQGLGLGLAIVRRIAALLDIGLQLHSGPGQGTRVELRLPRSQDLAMAPATPAAETTPVAAWPPLALRVLVIDDEPDIRDSMHSLLEQLGCEARCAEDLQHALAQVQGGFRPEVLLIHHRLREGDGLSAIETLRQVLGPVHALLVTGDTAPQTLSLLLASGHRVLHKPVAGAVLADALRELAQQR